MIITVRSMEVETRTLPRVMRVLGSELPAASVSSAVDKSVTFRCDDKNKGVATVYPLKEFDRGNASTDRGGGGNENVSSAKGTRHYSFSQEDSSQSNVHRRRNSERYCLEFENFTYSIYLNRLRRYHSHDLLWRIRVK